MNKKVTGIILIVVAVVLLVWAWGRVKPYLTTPAPGPDAATGEMTTAPI